MTSLNRIMSTITILFAIAALGIYFLTEYATRPEGETILPFPLLSVLVVVMLFIVTTIFFYTTAKNQEQEIIEFSDTADKAVSELEQLKTSQEERIEKRTFEISVANAALNREIAERIQAEAETRRIKRQMELILESAGDGIIGLDAKGKITFVNKAVSKLLGWKADELLGKPHHETVHHSRENGEPYPIDECPISQAFRDGIAHNGSGEVFWTKDRTFIPIEYISTPIIENGIITGAVIVFHVQQVDNNNKNRLSAVTPHIRRSTS